MPETDQNFESNFWSSYDEKSMISNSKVETRPSRNLYEQMSLVLGLFQRESVSMFGNYTLGGIEIPRVFRVQTFEG